MASFRQLKSGSWQASIHVRGIRESKTFKTKPEAQQWALDTELMLKSGEELARGKTLRDAMARYGKEVSVKKKGEKWELVWFE